MNTMADRLKHAIELNMTNGAELAQRLGLARGTVYNILNGTTSAEKISAQTAFALADALRAEARWLVTGVGAAPRLLPEPEREHWRNTLDQAFAVVTKERAWREDIERRLRALEGGDERG